ncbi:MAG TPA: hypothetical protein ENN55_05780, partial [Firmicutes bacterium]|nr:hypothetical protein [Bacillota bacterium]
MICEKCKKKTDYDSGFCKSCGAAVTGGKPASVEEKKIRAKDARTKKAALPGSVFLSGRAEAAGQETIWAPEKKKREGRKFGFVSAAGPFVWMIIAVAAIFLGHQRMFFAKQIEPAVIMYAVGLFFAGVAYLVSRRGELKINIGIKTEIVLFALIIFTALFFRMHNIESVPAGLFSDEAQNGV